MRTLESRSTIAAARERVFSVFTDFEHAAERIEGIKTLEVLTDGPVGVGTRFRETRELYGRQATETMEITAFEAPERYVAETRSHGAHFLSEFRFTDRGEDGTEVRVRFEVRPLSWFAKLMSVLSSLMMKSVLRTIEQDIADLKRHLEASA